ncbi:hypothetical protein PG996_011580 [Apiospora saccharicola]|uniref:Uncharacterized protein n=1 Tax=Apiospora saccharicola TaxID=335842 RepID=A0ABR1UFG5_9PEZI
MSGLTKPLTKPQTKRLAQSLRPAAVKTMKIDLSLYDHFRNDNEEQYRTTYPKRALSRLSNQANRSHRRRKTSLRTGIENPDDDDDDVRLARSDVPLPGDSSHSKPRLERQEAFRGASVGGGFVSSDDVVENDADLYRLGLLYDDGDEEGNRGPGFDLNAIVHEEPVYAVRLSRRKRKGGKNSNNNNTRMYTPGTPLHVIYETMEDSLYSMSPSLLEAYGFGGEGEGEDWSFIPSLVPHGSSTTADTVSADEVTTPSTEAWVVLEGA